MNNYCGGPTWLQWVKQVLDKINEVVERINRLTSDVMNVRQLPSGGSHGQVATPTEDGSGYEWVDQTGGGGGGETPTITVGSTTTGAPGTNASVDAEQVSGGVVLNFTIPRGNPGEKGADGKTPVVSVSGTDTGEPGTPAIVESSSTAEGIALRFTIPRGADGSDGTPGVGVPAGGTAGQVLAKVDGTDYNTQWVDQTGGGGSSETNWTSVGIESTTNFNEPKSVSCYIDSKNPLHVRIEGYGVCGSGSFGILFNATNATSTIGVPVMCRMNSNSGLSGFAFASAYYNNNKKLQLFSNVCLSKASAGSSWQITTPSSSFVAFSFEGYIPSLSSPIGDVPVDPGESGPGEM